MGFGAGIVPWQGGQALAQGAQSSWGCPWIPGSAQGQAGHWGWEQPGQEMNLSSFLVSCQLFLKANPKGLLFPKLVLDSPGRLDEEHRLIARYAARLAAEAGNAVSDPSLPAPGFYCFLIPALGAAAGGRERNENKQRSVNEEFKQLRGHGGLEKPSHGKAQPGKGRSCHGQHSPGPRKAGLLAGNRREHGSSLLGAQAGGSAQPSPTHGRPPAVPVRSASAGSTPTHGAQDSLAALGGDVHDAFTQGTRRNLRNDLLVAADSITNTMSSLVKELHSGKSWLRAPEKENWTPRVEDLSSDLFLAKAKEEDEEETEKLQNGKDRGEGTKLSESSAAFPDSLRVLWLPLQPHQGLWVQVAASGCLWIRWLWTRWVALGGSGPGVLMGSHGDLSWTRVPVSLC
uniref:Uncharacterized protein n=1 Tax=Cyanistes caeruleus TaxID=156563 RepID=A0A8C0VIC4_CYACU